MTHEDGIRSRYDKEHLVKECKLSNEQLPKWSILLAIVVKIRSKPIIRFQQSNLHMAKINVGKVSDMPPNSITKLENADVSVANVNGEFYAITDTCTHAGASMANGKIDGENIICGWHAASFECKSGKLAKFPAKIEDLKSYKVTVENGDVFVEV